MLPSLTKLILRAPISPHCLGIALGRNHLSVVATQRTSQEVVLRWIQEFPLTSPLFIGKPCQGDQKMITKLLGEIASKLGDDFTIIQVALPDPVVITQVFELESMPREHAHRRELALWRFSRDYHLAQDDIDCVCQGLGESNGKHLLLGLAIDHAWLTAIKAAFDESGLLPATIDSAACHRFNYFHDEITQDKKHGALIAIEPEYWSLSIWDDSGRLRFNRARWRDSNSGDQVLEIAAEAEHSVRAWLHGGNDYQFGHLYLIGQQLDCQRLTEVLTTRMQHAPITLACDQGIIHDNNVLLPGNFSCSALASSVQR